jgi:hypothetical protein
MKAIFSHQKQAKPEGDKANTDHNVHDEQKAVCD